MKNIRFLLWIAVGLLHTACIERSILLPETIVEPRLVVLAYAVDGLPTQVFVSKLYSIQADTLQYGVPDAEVNLFKNGRLEAELHYRQVQNCGDQIGDDGICVLRSSQHVTDDTLYLEDGATYHIEVKAAGFPRVASKSISFTRTLQDLRVDVVVRDSISMQSKQIGLIIDSISLAYTYTGDVTDELFIYKKNNYGRPSRGTLDEAVLDPRGYYPIPLDPLATDRQRFIGPGPIVNGYDTYLQEHSFSLHVARYPATYLRFIDLINEQDSDISGLYASAPASIPTNMTGGEGYFVIIEHYKVGDFIVEN